MSRNPENNPKDSTFLDQTLRPSAWDEYIGQESTKKNLSLLLRAAQERNHAPEHLLFYGPPGLGKTTLAHLIAHEIGGNLKATSGPAIEKIGDLASLLTNLAPGDIFFIDEIHRLNKTVEEVLYPAMESGVLDIIIGKGPSARALQLELPSFTLVAATTRIALLSSPLRSRFSGGIFRLEFYTEDQLTRIIERSASLLEIAIDAAAARAIAIRSRCTPRTANYLLKRCRDLAQLERETITEALAHKALALLDVDDLGLTPSDRAILETIIVKFNGGPVGLGTLAASCAEEPATIEDVYEPYLLQAGLIERTPRGRCATARSYEHVGYPVPEDLQQKLL